MTAQRVIAAVMVVLLAACSLDPRSEPGRSGSGSVADIAVFLLEGSTEQDLIAVSDLLFEPTPYIDSEGEQKVGQTIIPGLYGVDWDYVDYALYLRVLPGVSEDRVQEIISMVEADPRVDRVRRDYSVPSHDADT
jgi:hypothetical protein